MDDLTHLTDDELVTLGYSLGHQHDALREKRIAVRKEQDRRAAELRADALLSGLSENDVKILVERAGLKAGGKELN